MSLPIYRLKQGDTVQVIPTGDMLNGWIPGTIVNFVQSENKLGTYLSVQLASKSKKLKESCGFTLNGSCQLNNMFDYRFANDNEKSGRWTPDQNLAYTKSEQNYTLQFDENKQLSRSGNGITTINFDGGIFGIYTFEKYDNEYIESNGEKGKEIIWEDHVGELCGCSPRSLFTTLDNNVLKNPCEYRIGGVYYDQNNKKYIWIVRN